MNVSDSTPLVARPAVVDQDVFCQKCAYNLRGLRLGGVCPECGLELRLAIGGGTLGDCNPDWLGKLRRGVGLILASVLLSILLGIFDRLILAAAETSIPYGSLELIATAIQVFGVYLLTTPEPNRAHQENSVTLRNIVRFSAIAVLTGSLFELAPSSLPGPLRTMGALLSVFALVVYFGQLIYLRRFARRIPDHSLESSTNIVLWGVIITGSLVILGVVVFAFVALDASGGGAVAGGIFVCGAVIGYLIFGIWYLFLLNRYRAVFAEAERKSRGRMSGGSDSDNIEPGQRFT